jgi:hypothetical protein
MNKIENIRNVVLLISAISVLIIFPFITNSAQQEIQTGNLMGFIYGKDGKTPVPKAQVILHELVERDKAKGAKVYKSNITDKKGDYKLISVPVGTYTVRIKLRNKPYKIKRADFLVTIMAGKTGYVSFSLRKKRVPLVIIIPGVATGLGIIIPPEKEPEASPTKHSIWNKKKN